MNDKILITECPRDAIQGLHSFIPTTEKIQYLQRLLNCGFDRLDFGSFVSPKAMPQMADTAEVLANLVFPPNSPDLLAIVANERGALQAASYNEISFMGFPLSISETFQQRNTNAGFEEAWKRLKAISAIATDANKRLLVYLSMGFGNPYGDFFSPDLLSEWVLKVSELGVRHIALSDTIGVATPDLITNIGEKILSKNSNIEIGLHLHSNPYTANDKITAAIRVGFRHFDTAILGFGGCPMAKDELTGNLDTITLLNSLIASGFKSNIKSAEFEEAKNYAISFFSKFQ